MKKFKIYLILLITIFTFNCVDNSVIPDMTENNFNYKYFYLKQYDFDGSVGTVSKIISVNEISNFNNSRVTYNELLAGCENLYENLLLTDDESKKLNGEYVLSSIKLEDNSKLIIKSGSRVLIKDENEVGNIRLEGNSKIYVEQGGELVVSGEIRLEDYAKIIVVDKYNNNMNNIEDGSNELFFLNDVILENNSETSWYSTGYCSNNPFCSVSYCPNPDLPITISKFRATKNKNYIEFYIETVSEINADYMEIYGGVGDDKWFKINNIVYCDNIKNGSTYVIKFNIETGILNRIK